MKSRHSILILILLFFLLQACANGYKVTFFNGLNSKVEIYLKRKAPKRPLKFSDAQPKQYKVIAGKEPTLQGRLVAIFNGKGDMLYLQKVSYPNRSEKYQRESFTGTKELFMLITNKKMMQISVSKAEALKKNFTQ